MPSSNSASAGSGAGSGSASSATSGPGGSGGSGGSGGAGGAIAGAGGSGGSAPVYASITYGCTGDVDDAFEENDMSAQATPVALTGPVPDPPS